MGSYFLTHFRMLSCKNLISVNCLAMTEMTLIVLPNMVKKNKGVIINISSFLWKSAPMVAAYAASKAYVTILSQSLSQAYRRVCPGNAQHWIVIYVPPSSIYYIVNQEHLIWQVWYNHIGGSQHTSSCVDTIETKRSRTLCNVGLSILQEYYSIHWSQEWWTPHCLEETNISLTSSPYCGCTLGYSQSQLIHS